MKRVNKRGQFYLVAAMIIVAIVIGIASFSNYTNQRTSQHVYDLGQELGIESANILDYGTMNGSNTTELLENFTDSFEQYAGENVELYFIIGNENNIQAYRYINREKEEVDFAHGEGDITIKVDSNDYKFKLASGENFYFVISQEVGGEKYVATN